MTSNCVTRRHKYLSEYMKVLLFWTLVLGVIVIGFGLWIAMVLEYMK